MDICQDGDGSVLRRDADARRGGGNGLIGQHQMPERHGERAVGCGKIDMIRATSVSLNALRSDDALNSLLADGSFRSRRSRRSRRLPESSRTSHARHSNCSCYRRVCYNMPLSILLIVKSSGRYQYTQKRGTAPVVRDAFLLYRLWGEDKSPYGSLFVGRSLSRFHSRRADAVDLFEEL